MAAYELNIKAMSLADLEDSIAELHRRFQVVAQPGDAGLVDGAPSTAPRRGRSRGGARGLLDDVSAAAGAGAAGGLSADGAASETGNGAAGEPGDAAVGDTGAVQAGEAAQDQVADGKAAEGAQAPETDIFAEAEAEVGAETTGAAAGSDTAGSGAAAGKAAAEASDLPSDAGGAAAVGEGAADGEIPIEDFKAEVGEFIRVKGFTQAQALLKSHAVSKPGACPVEKRAAVLADMRKAMGQ